MNNRPLLPLCLTAIVLVIAACDSAPNTSGPVADLVLTGGKVYSLNWSEPNLDGQPSSDAPFSNGNWSPDASAIAIKDGLILGLGSDDEMSSFIG